MQFDCGHIYDRGFVTVRGALCALCAAAMAYPDHEITPRKPHGYRQAQFLKAYRDLAKRFPAWAEERLKKIARRMVRRNQVTL